MSQSGSVVWPSPADPIWRFNWRLSGDPEGTVITHAFYRGRRVFWKASLPSQRVQYDQGCGPYKDPLTEGNANTTQRCPQSLVCVHLHEWRPACRRRAIESPDRLVSAGAAMDLLGRRRDHAAPVQRWADVRRQPSPSRLLAARFRS